MQFLQRSRRAMESFSGHVRGMAFVGRSGSPGRLIALFALYALLAALVLGANPFKHETITPLDVLIKQRAWSWVDPDVKVRFSTRADVVDATLPQWLDARRQLRAGHMPLWNPVVTGGVPHFTPSYNTLTPGFMVFAAAPSPALGFLLATILNLAIAGAGMHLFLRRRLGWLAAFAGAFSFQFCGFVADWLYWPHVFTVIWAPWLLLAIDRCAQRPGLRPALGIALSSALLVLGGFPFVAELVFGMGFLYASMLLASQPSGGRMPFAMHYAAATLLGFLLCALPLVEFLAWMRQFDLGYRDGRSSYLTLRNMAQLLPPWSYRVKRVDQTMYVGATMMAMACVAGGFVLRERLRSAILPLFAVVLWVIAAGLVFDLWPAWLVGWFPGFSFNYWTRAIAVMDIALIVLAAVAIDRTWTFASLRGMPLLKVVVVALVLLQFAEMSHFFRRYNGPVSADYFYPDAPSIGFIKRHAGPFDQVIADNSFTFSGTLGAYGINEWFAHQYRTKSLQAAMRQMARHPFQTRTASKLATRDIKLDSSTMTTFNVRYVAISSEDPGSRRARKDSASAAGIRRPLPPMPAHRITQALTLAGKDADLDGVSIRLATYGRSRLPGRLRLALLDHHGTAVANTSIDTAYLVDNAFAEFYFAEPLHLASGSYRLSLWYAPAPGSANITAWSLTGQSDAQAGLMVDGKYHPGRLDYVLHRHRELSKQFRRVHTAAGITVLENRSSPNGPYFLSDLQQQPGPWSARRVRVTAWAADHFRLDYLDDRRGYVVVPMKLSTGWHVAVNGAPVVTSLKAGVMPAVPVSGPATITFEYRPRWLDWLLPWLGLVAISIIAIARLPKRSPPASGK